MPILMFLRVGFNHFKYLWMKMISLQTDSNDASRAAGGGDIFADETETLAMLKLTNCAQLYASDDSAVSQ